MQIVLQIFLLIIGFTLLVKGADFFVDGAAGIADKLGIPQLVVGLTIVAMGTSLPEASVSIVAALRGSAEITIGNVIGSNILNVLIILGLSSAIRSIAVQDSTVRYEIPFTIFVTVVLTGLGLIDNMIGRTEGIILWLLMVVYLAYLMRMAKNGKAISDNVSKQIRPVWQLMIMVFVGGAMIMAGSDITVDSATKLARFFGISERFIGLTIVALGTSLPELVTSVVAAKKGNADIAIGNIVGSNIFNILFVVGTAAIITPVVYSNGFLADSIVAIAAMFLLLGLVLPNRELNRKGGITMLISYAAYFCYLIIAK